MKLLLSLLVGLFYFSTFGQNPIQTNKTFEKFGIYEIYNTEKKTVSLKIYNRWGNTVFAIDTVLPKGTHTIKFGEKFEAGTYYSLLKIDTIEQKDFLTKLKSCESK